MNYLLDTDWIVHYLSGNGAVIRRLEDLRVDGLAISVISLAELCEGVCYSRNPEKNQAGVDNFLQDILVLGVDLEICKIFGQERGRLRKQGLLIHDFDLMIASTRLSHDLTLLSNNRRHYERIQGLRLVSL